MSVFARTGRMRQPKVAHTNSLNDLAPAGSDAEWIGRARPLLWLIVWLVTGYATFVNARAAPSLDYLVLGLVLDVCSPIGVWAFCKARQERRHGMAALSAVIVTLALVWSLFSALNTGAQGTFVAERATRHAAAGQQQVQASIAAAETELAATGSPRATVAVQAAIDAILQDPRAGGCTKLDGPFTRAECPKLAPLREELGRAKARDTAASKLATLRSKLQAAAPAPELEPAVEFAVRAAHWLGYSIEPDGVRLARAVLYMIALELLKFALAGWVAWLAPSPDSRKPVSAAPERRTVPSLPPAATAAPVPEDAAVEPATASPAAWLQKALAGGELPAGVERRNGGVFGSTRAFAAAWGVNPAKAQRLGQAWAASGEFAVVPSPRGTWIGPATAQRLRAVG